jgi:hypothetical protein
VKSKKQRLLRRRGDCRGRRAQEHALRADQGG